MVIAAPLRPRLALTRRETPTLAQQPPVTTCTLDQQTEGFPELVSAPSHPCASACGGYEDRAATDRHSPASQDNAAQTRGWPVQYISPTASTKGARRTIPLIFLLLATLGLIAFTDDLVAPAAIAGDNHMLVAEAGPAITGQEVPGAVLSASTGKWTPAPSRYTYVWTVNGNAIPGATRSTYVPRSDDIGKNLAVSVTAHRSGFSAQTVSSTSITVRAGALQTPTPPPPSSRVAAALPKPERSTVDPIAVLFNLLLHVLLLGSMLAFGFILYRETLNATGMERLRRFAALFLGAAVVIGAQLGGVSFAVFTAGALSNARGASAGASIVSALIPALLGVGVGYFLVKLMNTNENLAARVICFVGMLILAAFVEVYAAALKLHGVMLNVAALPNLSFAVGLVFMFVFFSGEDGQRSALRTLLRRRTASAPKRGPGSHAHNPFDI